MKPRKILLIGFALIILLATPLMAKNTLKVKCIDQQGNPLDDAKIYIQQITDEDIDDKDSNREGIATFKGLDDGYYRVWAHEAGFASAYNEFIKLRGNEEKTVELKFEPGDPSKRFYFEDPAIVAQAQQMIDEATTLLQNQNFAEAVTKYNQALALYPNQPLALHNLAVAYLNTQQWALSQETFEREISLIEELKAAGAFASPTAFDQQLQQAKDLMASIPFRRLAGEADAAMKVKDYETAVAKLREIEKIAPQNPQVYFSLSLALSQLKDWDAAEKAIDQALSMKPNDENFQSFKDQIRNLRENAAINREKNAVAELAELNKAGNHQEVIDRFDEVNEMITDEQLRAILLREKAQAHVDLKQYDEFFGTMEQVWRAEDSPVDEGLYQIGQQFANKGVSDASRLAFERILDVNPDFAEAYYELGMEYFYGTGDKEKAREFLEKYREIGSDEDHLSNAKNVLAVMDHQKN